MKNGSLLCLGGFKVLMIFCLKNPASPVYTHLLQIIDQVECLHAHNQHILMVGQFRSYSQIVNLLID